MRINFFNKPIFRFWRTALILVLIPTLELTLMIFLFKWWWITPLSVLVFGLLGAILARQQGLYCWIELNKQLDRGETPTVHILNGVLVLLAALLLLLPGVLTSLVGLMLFIPIIRSLVVSYVVLNFEAHRLRSQQKKAPSSPEIIDI